jgi:hypothetical protein
VRQHEWVILIVVQHLRVQNAEKIPNEGFRGILGWRYESPMIPQWIVEHTGGHPSFVQCFCRKLQEIVSKRGDRLIRASDVDAVFRDPHPKDSFIAHVRDTLAMNLEDPIREFLIPWLALVFGGSPGFTRSEILDLAEETVDASISDDELSHVLDRLVVTSVIEENEPGFYQFSVPDYPLILNRLGDTAHLDDLEKKMKEHLEGRQ